MADYTPPPELIQLKADFLANEAKLPELSGEEWREAREKSLEIALALHRADWWKTVDARYAADMALLKAAKDSLSTEAG
jgi:hypothetical protein